jgi:hypothetical protein
MCFFFSRISNDKDADDGLSPNMFDECATTQPPFVYALDMFIFFHEQLDSS